MELQSSNQGPSEFFLSFLNFSWPAKPVNRMCKISRSFREKKEHLNRRSEPKVMPVLRRTLRIRFLWWRWWNGCESVGNFLWDVSRGKWMHKTEPKTRTQPAQKDEYRTQTQHCGLWKRIMQKAKHGLGREKPNYKFFCFAAVLWTIGQRRKQR